jgi:hypothetical protein
VLEIKQSLGRPDTNINIVAEVTCTMNRNLKTHPLKEMENNIDKSIWIVDFISKVTCSMEYIMGSLNLPDDITTLNRENYPEVWKNISPCSFSDVETIKEGKLSLKKMMAITTSACLNENECEWAVSKLMIFGFSYPQYFFATKEGQLRSMVFYRKPTIHLARQIWNLPENGVTKEFVKLGMKSICTNLKIYIPVDGKTVPKDITINDGNSIQVRVLYDEPIVFKKKKKQAKFTLCGFSPQ